MQEDAPGRTTTRAAPVEIDGDLVHGHQTRAQLPCRNSCLLHARRQADASVAGRDECLRGSGHAPGEPPCASQVRLPDLLLLCWLVPQ